MTLLTTILPSVASLRVWVLRAESRSSLVIWCASDERYNDAVPTEFLHVLVKAGKAVVVALTKMREDETDVLVEHFRGEVLAKLPKSEQDRIGFNYWSALTDATSVKDGKLRLQVLISELEHGGYESAARCLSDDLDALVVHLRYPLRHGHVGRSGVASAG